MKDGIEKLGFKVGDVVLETNASNASSIRYTHKAKVTCKHDTIDEFYRIKTNDIDLTGFYIALENGIENFPCKKCKANKCPKCGNKKLAELHSLNLKICVDCGSRIKWKLKKGQKPLLVKTKKGK